MERIFDICHGCRRCVSLCGSFPTLFDLVDESKTMEVDGVDKKDYWKVVDQCYLCDLCYLTKCPYVPPHEWNLDFPHTMLRAKAIKFQKGEVGFGEKLLASTDVHGQFAGIPIVSQTVNAVNKTAIARNVMESQLGVDKNAWLPELATRKFRSAAPKSKAHAVRNGAKTPGKVVIYSTCFINYNEPGIGLDLLKLLDHNEVPYVLVEKEKCCGMPKLELGDLQAVNASKEVNIPVLARYAREGYAILSAVPSCTLMFKQEMPLMYPNDADVQAGAGGHVGPVRVHDGAQARRPAQDRVPPAAGQDQLPDPLPRPGAEHRQEDRGDAQDGAGHQRAHHERCSGHAGTFGVKKGTHQQAMKIGKPLFKAMANHKDGGGARRHQLRLPAGRPPHRAGLRGEPAPPGAAETPDHPDARSLRIEIGATPCNSPETSPPTAS
jgi:glycerol-3-phosphate dehydrogenase subunit C